MRPIYSIAIWWDLRVINANCTRQTCQKRALFPRKKPHVNHNDALPVTTIVVSICQELGGFRHIV